MSKGLLTDSEKAAMRKATHNAALVLLDDLHHIREIVEKDEPPPGDLRRMSNLLRRILVEGDLLKIATPRMGKITIQGPDLRHLYRANEKRPFLFLAADTFATHGIVFSNLIFEEGSSARDLPSFAPDNLIALRIEPFQNQKVLCFEGQWVTRADLIKYVANVGHGTHSGLPKDAVASLIRKIRACLTVEANAVGPNGEVGPSISFNRSVLAQDDEPIEFRPDAIDLALLHLISTAQFLTASPDVAELERTIRDAE